MKLRTEQQGELHRGPSKQRETSSDLTWVVDCKSRLAGECEARSMRSVPVPVPESALDPSLVVVPEEVPDVAVVQ